MVIGEDDEKLKKKKKQKDLNEDGEANPDEDEEEEDDEEMAALLGFSGFNTTKVLTSSLVMIYQLGCLFVGQGCRGESIWCSGWSSIEA